jgi:hypothetical protein
MGTQNNFEKVGMFLAPENSHPAHHVLPRIHHNFTTK